VTRLSATLVEPAGVARRSWPVTGGVPFAPGELRDAAALRVHDADGVDRPASARALATWPDGSVRWALLDTQVDIAAAQSLRLSVDTDGPLTEPRVAVAAESRDAGIDVTTGALAARLSAAGPRLFAALSRGRAEVLAAGDSAQLQAWIAGDERPFDGVVESVDVEETNPLRLVVRQQGRFARGDERLMGWSARHTFYAAQGFLRSQVTFVHDEASRSFVHLRRLRLRLPLSLDRVQRRALVGSHETGWQLTPPFDASTDAVTLTQWNVERHVITSGDSRIDRRSNALGWLQAQDDTAALTVKLRRPWQSYPKAWSLDDDGLALELFPDLSAFRGPDVEPGRRWTEIDYAGGVLHDEPLRLPQGMARTHELFLRLADPADDGRSVDAFALAAEMPLLLQLPSERWNETGVLGPFPAFDEARWPLELKLRRFSRAPNGRGIVNDGDEVRLETTADGHVVTRTTENLAYELPRSLLRQYLRAGDQRLFWEAEASVRHLMDVDTVHFSTAHPEWIGGPCFEWSQNHHYANTDEAELKGPRTSHTWLGSLLDYHFLTGCPRAKEVARMCADYCRRAAPYDWKESLTAAAVAAPHEAQSWPWSTRVVGWALTGMGTFHEAFPDDRFLPAMESLVDLLEVWQDEDGRWRDQIGSHNRGATPFMISGVLQGLQLFHRATGDRRARRMVIDGARFLARQGRTREGIFTYKEAPISDSPHASTVMCLSPLAWAYEETGDPDLLDAGYRLFRWLVEENGVATYMLKDLFAFMPLLRRTGLLDEWRPPDARRAASREEA
jgi:rhamnogalacturonyl hydrolase YesR